MLFKVAVPLMVSDRTAIMWSLSGMGTFALSAAAVLFGTEYTPPTMFEKWVHTLSFVAFSTMVLTQCTMGFAAKYTLRKTSMASMVLSVQTIASVSNMIMLFNSPFGVDALTGNKVEYIRICQWTVNIFLMCILADSIEETKISNRTFRLGGCMAGSVLCCAFFPLAAFPGLITLWTLSFVLFAYLPLHIYLIAGDSFTSPLKITVMKYCSMMWTIIVINYCVAAAFDERYYIVSTAVVDFVSKSIYAAAVGDIYERYPQLARQRSLSDIVNHMQIAWTHCSDVLIVSKRQSHGIFHSVASPSIRKFTDDQEAWGKGVTHTMTSKSEVIQLISRSWDSRSSSSFFETALMRGTYLCEVCSAVNDDGSALVIVIRDKTEAHLNRELSFRSTSISRNSRVGPTTVISPPQ